MGLEYTHGLFVEDLSWRPAWHHVEAVERVLAAWGFPRENPWFSEVTENGLRPVADATARAELARTQLVVSYGSLDGPGVRTLMGASMYPGLADEHRYVTGVDLHLGSNFKVVFAEGWHAQVTTPPMNGMLPVKPYEDVIGLDSQIIFRASWDTTPPRTDATGDFSGVWRCGLLLDCHKDVPSFAGTNGKLPAKDFVTQLEAAFETKLVEVGWLH